MQTNLTKSLKIRNHSNAKKTKKNISTFGSGKWSAQTRDFILGHALLALRSQNANVNVAVASMSIGIDENSRSRRLFDSAYCRSAATFTKTCSKLAATPPPFATFFYRLFVRRTLRERRGIESILTRVLKLRARVLCKRGRLADQARS